MSFEKIMYQSQLYICCRYVNTIHYKQIRVRSGQITFLTVDFYFTEFNQGVTRISLRIGRMSPIVVVDDVSPVVRTGDLDRIRDCGCGVVCVPKTQHSVFFVCCVGDVHRESQEMPSVIIVFI